MAVRPVKARLVAHAELELRRGKVIDDGGELRVLSGADVGLVTSIMSSRVVPASGPLRHRHPHAEVLVLQEGQARFEVEGLALDAVAGDMVVVPPEAWHGFVNTGTGMLRLTAVHENPRATTIFEDGRRHD